MANHVAAPPVGSVHHLLFHVLHDFLWFFHVHRRGRRRERSHRLRFYIGHGRDGPHLSGMGFGLGHVGLWSWLVIRGRFWGINRGRFWLGYIRSRFNIRCWFRFSVRGFGFGIGNVGLWGWLVIRGWFRHINGGRFWLGCIGSGFDIRHRLGFSVRGAGVRFRLWFDVGFGTVRFFWPAVHWRRRRRRRRWRGLRVVRVRFVVVPRLSERCVVLPVPTAFKWVWD